MRNKKRFFSLAMAAVLLATMAPWSSIKASASFTGALQFNANGKFIIMQCNDIQDDQSVDSTVISAITKNIARYHPDLVVFDGDNIIETISSVANFQSSVNQFLAPLLATNTKFAITFGNHDSDGSGGSLSSQYAYYKSHGGSLFIDQDVAALDGDASGVIPIYANGQTSGTPAYQVYVMDSGHNPSAGSYDSCYTSQIDYYIQRSQLYPTVPSIWFQHVIVPDIYTRCMTTTSNGTTGYTGNGTPFSSHTYYIDTARINYARSYSTNISDMYKEKPCPSNQAVYEAAAHRSSATYGSKTLYEAWRDYGNFKGAYFGHDHLNKFTCTTSDGIDLGYGKGTTMYKTAGIFSYNDGNPGCSIYQLDISGSYTNEYSTNVELANDAMVTFDANGGLGTVRDQWVAKNSSATLHLNAFTKAGFTFSGWNTKADGTGTSYADGASITVSGITDVTLYAKWTASIFSNITFDANGGNGGTGPTSMQYGTTLTAPIVTRTGYTFTGWSPTVPATVPAANTTYTAQWKVKDYAITFDDNGGTGGEVQTVSYGVTPTTPTVTKEGYSFEGWSPDVAAVTGDTTYTAQWKPIIYFANFYVGSDLYEAYSYYFGDNLIEPFNPTKAGFMFAGWDHPVPATMPAEDLTFNALWTAASTISFGTFGASDISPITGAVGSAVIAPEDPVMTGFTFTGWFPALPVTFPAEDITVYAQWKANDYTVTFDDNGGTGGEVQSVTYGVTPTPPTVTKEGYSFEGWSPDVVAVTGDTTYTAQWKANLYFANFYVGSDLYDAYSYYFGDYLIEPLNPTKDGFIFAGWDRVVPATMPAEDLTFNALWTPVSTPTLQAAAGSTTVINTTDNYIYGLKPGLTQADFESNYVSISGNGKLVYTPSTGSLGTGTKVDLVDNSTGTVLQTYYILIFGDVNGDGNIDSIDAGVMVDVQNYATVWDPVANAFYFKAGDLNGDGNIDSIDAGLTVDFQNYMVNINQATGSVV